MSKIAAVLVFAAVTVLTGSAHATTLTVTGGGISVSQGTEFEPDVDLTGDGFSLHGYGHLPCCAFGPESETFPFTVATLTLGDITFAARNPGDPGDNNSLLAIVRAPDALPEPPCGEFGICEPWSAAFTMTGQIGSLSGGGVDLVGQGVVSHSLIVDPENPPFGTYLLTYTFHPVPEPATLLLVVTALCALGALIGARFLRERHAARLLTK
jgi:hypothetical protein